MKEFLHDILVVCKALFPGKILSMKDISYLSLTILLL